jgi:hypothetical protein
MPPKILPAGSTHYPGTLAHFKSCQGLARQPFLQLDTVGCGATAPAYFVVSIALFFAGVSITMGIYLSPVHAILGHSSFAG